MKINVFTSIFTSLLFALCEAHAGQAPSDINSPIHSRDFDDEIDPLDANRVRVISYGSSQFRVGYIKIGCWVRYSGFNFGAGVSDFEIETATNRNGDKIELWLNATVNPDRTLSGGTKIGSVTASSTGGFTTFKTLSTALSPFPSGTQDLFLKFVGNGTGTGAEYLVDTRTFKFTAENMPEGRLHVYPPVPGFAMTPAKWAALTKDQWTESPYYTYRIQKISALNNPDFALATNWETPFAFFTRCIDYNPAKNTAYFEEYIGGWSHTYCNFELDPHTPVVIKIHRRTQAEMTALGIVSEAPKGPITRAVAYPTRKVDSCEIINGDVYVTMRHPALIAVDIDGQMDNRDAPRATATGWQTAQPHPFPYRNEKDGSHGVTIFANPFIEDKPDMNDAANVLVVYPGQKPPASFTQPILYFAPGVHKFSVDEFGNERGWIESDRIAPISNKSYYIPGDTVVYGNFSDPLHQVVSKNIRFFGHGTISGAKMAHFNDTDTPTPDKSLRLLHVDKSENVIYEGLTMANPPEHTVAIVADKNRNYPPNYIKWCKSISWRVNNDGMTAQGNSYLEDCFMRHQDDGSYVRGNAIRRTTYWSDVNGCPLRGSFMTEDRDARYPSALPEHLIVEDCDIIYSRAVFTTTNNSEKNGIIAQWEGTSATLADGTKNTGQHLIFRNIIVSDPRPQRPLFTFTGGKTGDWIGLRFENIDYLHGHTWGWTNKLTGDADTQLKNWTFKNVHINGRYLDQTHLNDTSVFTISNVSGMIFQP